jgi:hypothetical protein
VSIEAGATSTTEPDSAPWEDRPSFALQALTVLWAGLAGVGSARVYPGLMLFGLVFLGGIALGLKWIYQFVRRWRARARHPALGCWGRLAWGFCPAVGVLLTALFLTQIPLIVRIKASEGALIAMAESDPPEQRRRAGFMFVRSVHVAGDLVFYETGNTPIFNTFGVVCSRDRREPRAGFEDGYRGFNTDFWHLFGNWWAFFARD